MAEEICMVAWHPHLPDVVRNGTSKASGVAHVAELEGLKPENILVSGDELNGHGTL